MPSTISSSVSEPGNSDLPGVFLPGPCPPPVASPSRICRRRALVTLIATLFLCFGIRGKIAFPVCVIAPGYFTKAEDHTEHPATNDIATKFNPELHLLAQWQSLLLGIRVGEAATTSNVTALLPISYSQHPGFASRRQPEGPTFTSGSRRCSPAAWPAKKSLTLAQFSDIGPRDSSRRGSTRRRTVPRRRPDRAAGR